MEAVLGIVTAFPLEARAILGQRGWRRQDGRLVKRLVLADRSAILGVCAGPGRANGIEAVRWLAGQNTAMIAAVGVAGGLDPALQAGDLLVGERVAEEFGSGRFLVRQPDQRLGRRVERILTAQGLVCRPAAIFSPAGALLEAAAKREQYRSHGSAAVDLESGGVLAAAQEAQLPCFVLRAICDSQKRQVDQSLAAMLAPNGNLRFGVLLRRINRQPRLMIELLWLARDFLLAVRVLRRAMGLLARPLAMEIRGELEKTGAPETGTLQAYASYRRGSETEQTLP